MRHQGLPLASSAISPTEPAHRQDRRGISRPYGTSAVRIQAVLSAPRRPSTRGLLVSSLAVEQVNGPAGDIGLPGPPVIGDTTAEILSTVDKENPLRGRRHPKTLATRLKRRGSNRRIRSSADATHQEVEMKSRRMRRSLRGLAATAVIAGALTGGVASAAHASTGTESHTIKTAAAGSGAIRTSSWTPIAAYQTYGECQAAAASFPGYAYCGYVGGSYPWVLWVWTW